MVDVGLICRSVDVQFSGSVYWESTEARSQRFFSQRNLTGARQVPTEGEQVFYDSVGAQRIPWVRDCYLVGLFEAGTVPVRDGARYVFC